MTIWKTVGVKVARQDIKMPFPFRIIHVGEQGGIPYLWAEVDESKPLVTRTIVVVGTGMDMPPGNLRHLGSVQCGPFMWHVYEEAAE
jgi:hypothetical protein